MRRARFARLRGTRCARTFMSELKLRPPKEQRRAANTNTKAPANGPAEAGRYRWCGRPFSMRGRLVEELGWARRWQSHRTPKVLDGVGCVGIGGEILRCAQNDSVTAKAKAKAKQKQKQKRKRNAAWRSGGRRNWQ